MGYMFVYGRRLVRDLAFSCILIETLALEGSLGPNLRLPSP